jgi:hypothetical protein
MSYQIRKQNTLFPIHSIQYIYNKRCILCKHPFNPTFQTVRANSARVALTFEVYMADILILLVDGD